MNLIYSETSSIGEFPLSRTFYKAIYVPAVYDISRKKIIPAVGGRYCSKKRAQEYIDTGFAGYL